MFNFVHDYYRCCCRGMKIHVLIFCTPRVCSLSDSVCEGSWVFMTAQSSITTVKINIQLPVREAEGSGDILEPNLCLSIYLPWSKFLSKLELPSLEQHPPTNHGEVSFCPVAQSFQERTWLCCSLQHCKQRLANASCIYIYKSNKKNGQNESGRSLKEST